MSPWILFQQNVEEVVKILKREVAKTIQEYSKVNEYKGEIYRGILIHTIYGCVIPFVQVAEIIVVVLMNFLSIDDGM